MKRKKSLRQSFREYVLKGIAMQYPIEVSVESNTEEHGTIRMEEEKRFLRKSRQKPVYVIDSDLSGLKEGTYWIHPPSTVTRSFSRNNSEVLQAITDLQEQRNQERNNLEALLHTFGTHSVSEVSELSEDKEAKLLFEILSMRQIKDPYESMKELWQNSDGATFPGQKNRIDVVLESINFEGLGPIPAGKYKMLKVSDKGRGMSKQDIDEKLFTLGASDNEKNSMAEGEFGVGFSSVPALKPSWIIVDSRRHDGINGGAIVDGQISIHPYDSQKSDIGTDITLLFPEDKKIDASRIREIANYFTPHLRTPIFFTVEGKNEQLTKPFLPDSNVESILFEEEGVKGYLEFKPKKAKGIRIQSRNITLFEIPDEDYDGIISYEQGLPKPIGRNSVNAELVELINKLISEKKEELFNKTSTNSVTLDLSLREMAYDVRKKSKKLHEFPDPSILTVDYVTAEISHLFEGNNFTRPMFQKIPGLKKLNTNFYREINYAVYSLIAIGALDVALSASSLANARNHDPFTHYDYYVQLQSLLYMIEGVSLMGLGYFLGFGKDYSKNISDSIQKTIGDFYNMTKKGVSRLAGNIVLGGTLLALLLNVALPRLNYELLDILSLPHQENMKNQSENFPKYTLFGRPVEETYEKLSNFQSNGPRLELPEIVIYRHGGYGVYFGRGKTPMIKIYQDTDGNWTIGGSDVVLDKPGDHSMNIPRERYDPTVEQLGLANTIELFPPNLGMTSMEFDEFGNKINDPDKYLTIAIYSYFDNGEWQAYPSASPSDEDFGKIYTYWSINDKVSYDIILQVHAEMAKGATVDDKVKIAENWIDTNFYYNLDTESSIQGWIDEKEVKCDSANTLLAYILRTYGIGVRAHAGYLQVYENEELKGSGKHMWLNYFDGTEWEFVDATPQRLAPGAVLNYTVLTFEDLARSEGRTLEEWRETYDIYFDLTPTPTPFTEDMVVLPGLTIIPASTYHAGQTMTATYDPTNQSLTTQLPTETPSPANTVPPTRTHNPNATSTLMGPPNYTPLPTDTPLPTNTALPTDTPQPTGTSTPIATYTATPSPIVVGENTVTGTLPVVGSTQTTDLPTEAPTLTMVPSSTATSTIDACVTGNCNEETQNEEGSNLLIAISTICGLFAGIGAAGVGLKRKFSRYMLNKKGVDIQEIIELIDSQKTEMKSFFSGYMGTFDIESGNLLRIQIRHGDIKTGVSIYDMNENPGNYVYAKSSTYHAIHDLSGRVLMPNSLYTKDLADMLLDLGLKIQQMEYEVAPIKLESRSELDTYIIEISQSILAKAGLHNYFVGIELGNLAENELVRVAPTRKRGGGNIIYIDPGHIRQEDFKSAEELKEQANNYIAAALTEAVNRSNISGKGRIYESIARGMMR